MHTVVHYAAGILSWSVNDLKSMDMKMLKITEGFTREVMLIMFFFRKMGGRF